jgi:hypothetical protein
MAAMAVMAVVKPDHLVVARRFAGADALGEGLEW